jgi:hypothetical protein
LLKTKTARHKTSRKVDGELGTQIGARQEKTSCRDARKVTLNDLLDLDLGASRFDLLLDLFGFFLGDAFLQGFGAPSTRALASARPRPATHARTSLMTAILLPPVSLRMTSKAVFSSAGAAAAPPAAGAAARDWSCCTDAPLLFEGLNEISHFEDGESAELFN